MRVKRRETICLDLWVVVVTLVVQIIRINLKDIADELKVE